MSTTVYHYDQQMITVYNMRKRERIYDGSSFYPLLMPHTMLKSKSKSFERKHLTPVYILHILSIEWVAIMYMRHTFGMLEHCTHMSNISHEWYRNHFKTKMVKSSLQQRVCGLCHCHIFPSYYNWCMQITTEIDIWRIPSFHLNQLHLVSCVQYSQ